MYEILNLQCFTTIQFICFFIFMAVYIKNLRKTYGKFKNFAIQMRLPHRDKTMFFRFHSRDIHDTHVANTKILCISNPWGIGCTAGYHYPYILTSTPVWPRIGFSRMYSRWSRRATMNCGLFGKKKKKRKRVVIIKSTLPTRVYIHTYRYLLGIQ